MYRGLQQDHAGSAARSSTLTDKPQRKPVLIVCDQKVADSTFRRALLRSNPGHVVHIFVPLLHQAVQFATDVNYGEPEMIADVPCPMHLYVHRAVRGRAMC